MIDHDERREAELQLLCYLVLQNWGEYHSDNYGADYVSCKYCDSSVAKVSIRQGRVNIQKNIKKIKHQQSCPVLIARDLSRGK